jgi:hypothetical protein
LFAGIPFCDYRTYCIKILFPGVEEHPVLQWDRPDLARKEKGLRLFGQLVMNKVRFWSCHYNTIWPVRPNEMRFFV